MARASRTRRNATPNPVGLPLRFQSILLSNPSFGGLLLIVSSVCSSVLCPPLSLVLNFLTRFVDSLLDFPLLFLDFFPNLTSVLYNLLLLLRDTLLQIGLLRRGGRRGHGAR